MHLRTAAQRDAGLAGGEGFQQLIDIQYAPSDPSIVYMCTDTSQAWKSTDGGRHWMSKPNGLMCNGGRSLIVYQANSSRVLMAGFDKDGSGIYRTIDGGDNWSRRYTTQYDNTKLMRGQKLFHQVDNTVFYAALQDGNGLVTSTDSGYSWTPVIFDLSSTAQDNELGCILNMVQNPYNPDLELWVCSFSGLYKITESTTPGQFHCVELTPSGLPSKFTGWTRTADPAGAITLLDSVTYITNAFYHSSLRVDFDGKIGYWHTKWINIPVSAGTEYTVEGYIKTENLDTSYGGAYMSAQDSRGTDYGFWPSSKIKGTTGWTNVTLTFTPASGTTNLYLLLRRQPSETVVGKMWFDSIKLYPSSTGPSGNLLVTDKGGNDYSDFEGDTPVAIHFGDSNEVIVACGLSGIYRSTDGGLSFNAANSGLNSTYLGKCRLNLNGSDADRNLLVAGFYNAGNESSYVSANGALNWSEIENITLTNSFLQYDIVPSEEKMSINYFTTPTGFHPTDPNIMLHPFNDSVIYSSTNKGVTWFYSGEGYSGGRAAGGFSFGGSDPRTTYLFLTDHGPFVTHDGGRTWKRLIPPRYLGYTATAGVSDPDDSDIILCAVGDWSSQMVNKSDDGGESWSTNLTGTAASYQFIAMDPLNSSTVYCDNYKSINEGDSWSPLSRYVIAICEGTGAVYAKEQGSTSTKTKIYKSINGGVTWTAYANEIPVPKAQVAGIAVSPVDEDRIYVAAQYSGIYILQDGVWVLKNESNGITKDSFNAYDIQHVTVDPVNPDIVYLGKRVQWLGHSDGVCASTDAGMTWTNISGNLSRYSTVWNMKVNPNNDAAYIATSHGTWLMSSLMLNYHFDEASGGNVYNDSIYSITTNSANEGDAVRGTGTAIVTGRKNRALSFDGSSEAYVELSSYPDYLTNSVTKFSVEAIVWFNNSNALTNGPMVSDRNSFNLWNGFFLRSWYGKLSFNVAKDATHYCVGTSSLGVLSTGSWFHVVGTFDNGTMKLYVNGTQAASTNAGFTSFAMQTGTPFYVGKCDINPTNFNGKIDEVKIYNRALSETEVANKYTYYFAQ